MKKHMKNIYNIFVLKSSMDVNFLFLTEIKQCKVYKGVGAALGQFGAFGQMDRKMVKFKPA